MTKIKIHILSLISLLLCVTSCNSNDELDIEDGSDYTGAIIQQNAFSPGDEVTRSTLVFGDGGLKFTWIYGDKLGMFPTAKKSDGTVLDGLISRDETNPATIHPNPDLFYTNPSTTQQALYKITRTASSSLMAKIEMESTSGSEAFDWDAQDGNTYWTLYSKYNAGFVPGNNKYYNCLPFDFSNQVQQGLVDMNSYYTAGGYQSSNYANSEAKACKHLGETDVLISAETQFHLPQTIFYMRHLGAVARFFLLAPDKELTLESLRLICDKKIFYEKGTFDLTSHPYQGDETKGMCLVGDEGAKQMAPDESTLTNSLELKFSTGVKINQTSTANPYSNYLVAYLMMYPITYNSATDGNLYVYVTAKDKDNKVVHFVSEALANKTMKSGYYYQWTSRTHEQDGLYPIELTATVVPWENIVAGSISTGTDD